MSDETIVVESPPVREVIELAGRNLELLEISQTETLVVDQAPCPDLIELESDCIEIIEVVERGPQGIPGLPGETMPYAKRTDFVGENLIYKGEAVPGSADGDPVWRISRVTIAGDDITEKWAEGSADFSLSWSAHADYDYR